MKTTCHYLLAFCCCCLSVHAADTARVIDLNPITGTSLSTNSWLVVYDSGVANVTNRTRRVLETNYVRQLQFAALSNYFVSYISTNINTNASQLLVNGSSVLMANLTNASTVVFLLSDTNVSAYVTNIANAQIASGAAIDAAKLADGTVSSTEFQYLNTVTNNVQNQINTVRTNAANWLAVGTTSSLLDGSATVSNLFAVGGNIRLNGVSVTDAAIFTSGTLASARLDTDVVRHDGGGVDGATVNEENISGRTVWWQVGTTNFSASFETNEIVALDITDHSTFTFDPPVSTNVDKLVVLRAISDTATNLLTFLPTNVIVFGGGSSNTITLPAGSSTIYAEGSAGTVYVKPDWLFTETAGPLYQTATGLIVSNRPATYGFAASDLTTALTTGDGKELIPIPKAFTLTSVYAYVRTAPVGSAIVIDLTENGTSIFSTLLSIDAGETNSVTAATNAVISDASIAAHSVIGVNIDQVGSSTAGDGLKIWLLGYE